MRVFITGIEGFVGRHLAVRLAVDGHQVEGSAHRRDAGIPGVDRIARLDVRDADAVAAVVERADPDAVVHLAGAASVADSFEDPAKTFEVNALGSINVLEACRRANVARVVLVTSCEVYGDPDPGDGPVEETAQLAPINPYGASKAAQDMIGHQYARSFGVPVVRVRPFPHTGPGQAARYLFPSVARRIAVAEAGRGPSEIGVGNVGTTRDLLDVRDVVDAYIRLLDVGVPGEVYNVCTGRGRRLDAALDALCEQAEVPIEIVPDPGQRRPTDFDWMVGDPGKLEQATGWQPTFDWKTTMADLLDDMRTRVDAGEALGVEADE